MKLKYIGRHTAVEVEYPDGGGFEVERDGETPELIEGFAASLLEQETNWQPNDAESEALAESLAELAQRQSDDEEQEVHFVSQITTGDEHKEDAE